MDGKEEGKKEDKNENLNMTEEEKARKKIEEEENGIELGGYYERYFCL